MFRPLYPAVLILVGLIPVSRGTGQDRPDLQDLVPASTLVFIETRDAAELMRTLSDRFPLAALARDREVQPFLAPLEEMLARAEEEILPVLGARPGDLLPLMKGQAAIAFLDAPGEEGPPIPDFVLAIGLVDDAMLARRVFSRVKASASEVGEILVETEKVEGFSVTAFDWSGRFTPCACLTGDAFFLSTSAAVMKHVLARLKENRGVGGNLSASDRFKNARNRADAREAHAFCFLNLEAVWKSLDRIFGRGYPEVQLVMEGLNLRKIHSAGISLSVTEAGIRERVYIGGTGRIASILLGKPGLRGADLIRGESLLYLGHVMNWEAWVEWAITSLRKTALRLENEKILEVAGILRIVEEGALGFDLKKELLGALGREASLSLSLPASTFFPRAVALIEVKDRDRLLRVIEKIKEQLPEDLGKLEMVSYRGHRLIGIGIRGSSITPALSVTGDQLVIGTSVNEVKRWLRSKREPLARTPAFRKALSLIGLQDLSGAFSAMYLDVQKMVTFAYGNFLTLAEKWMPGEIPLGLYTIKLDAARLPSTEVVARLLGPMAVVTRPCEEGLVMDSIAPLPFLGSTLFFLEGVLFTGITGIRIPPGELGVYVDDGFAGEGCRIAFVAPGKCGARAGLRSGDVILRMNGKATRNSDAAIAIVGAMHAGEILKLRILRDKRTLIVDVVLQLKAIK